MSLASSHQQVCDGESEAKLIALWRTSQESGRWSLRLLTDKTIELKIVPAICHEAVRKVIKTRIKALQL